MTEKYEDIINLPHHVSKTRPQMSMLERAAQFSPFAALNGYDDAVKETGRLTDERSSEMKNETCWIGSSSISKRLLLIGRRLPLPFSSQTRRSQAVLIPPSLAT